MNVAFYAPLKPPDHPTPSGDRLMARLLVKALAAAGHEVRLASRLRTFTTDPSESAYLELRALAKTEAAALAEAWTRSDATWIPDCWFTYHPYYKAPDWIGPAVCARLSLPYVTAEASYAGKRDAGEWQRWQADVVPALRAAAANFCFTGQDKEGLARLDPPVGPLIDIAPFIEVVQDTRLARRSTAVPRIAVIAMMRHGDKLASYRLLSETLQALHALPWRVAVMGDGPARGEVLAAFSAIAPDRIDWLGQVEPDTVTAELSACDLYVWPGIGEAYGLAYLEAQAMGLPVVAMDAGGVPAVVRRGVTALLTPAGEVQAFAAAVQSLVVDSALRTSMGEAAARFVREECSVEAAAGRIGTALAAALADVRGRRM